MIQKPAYIHKFPAYINEKPASFASKVTSIKIDLRQVRFWYSLELIIPISDFLLYPSHTYLSVSYSVCSCEGCEGIVLLAWPKRTKRSRSYSFFSLERKEPKVQGCVCWATLSLRFAVRVANSLRSDKQRSGRSTSFLRLTLTRTRPAFQLIIDNW